MFADFALFCINLPAVANEQQLHHESLTHTPKLLNGIFKEEKSFHLIFLFSRNEREWKKNLQMKQVVCESVSKRNEQFANKTECVIWLVLGCKYII